MRSTSFKPRLEVLEDRQVPTVTTSFNAATGALTISGDKRANLIDIVSDGAGSITVTGDGVTTGPFFGITSLNVKAGSGNDRITYTSPGDVFNGGAFNVNIDMGGGSDTFIADLGATSFNNGTTANFNVKGSSGADNVRITGFNGGVVVDATSTLNLNIAGNGGRDFIDTNFTGELDGTFNYNVTGGSGKDNIRAIFNSLDDTDAVAGRLNIKVKGGSGSDNYVIILNESAPGAGLVTANARVDGGSKDNAFITPGVVVKGVKAKNIHYVPVNTIFFQDPVF